MKLLISAINQTNRLLFSRTRESLCWKRSTDHVLPCGDVIGLTLSPNLRCLGEELTNTYPVRPLLGERALRPQNEDEENKILKVLHRDHITVAPCWRGKFHKIKENVIPTGRDTPLQLRRGKLPRKSDHEALPNVAPSALGEHIPSRLYATMRMTFAARYPKRSEESGYQEGWRNTPIGSL